ncbi:MAG: UbiH/UbiF/VisC/COQ6 family ubiquinone biosynthesis hydroxylase [Rhodospirillales bacterium]|nr:UbiH/UbiF/VisC/COQ6 family ubiquinone biosynthesis hydroxylase [Rhodospirillales bacterium]
MEPDLRCEVLIVGGGMVGLSLGLALARAGLAVAVIDREAPAAREEEAFDGRSSAIAHASRRILDGIGVWAEIREEAEAILDIRVSDGRVGRPAAPLFLHFDHRDVATPFGHIVENHVIRRVLGSAVAACPNLFHLAPADLAEAEREPHGVSARLGDGRRIAARLLVAADGRDSRLRREARIPALRWSYPQTGIVATVGHEAPHEGVAHEHFLPSGPFAMLPMTGDRSSIVWTERRELAATMLALDAAGFAAEIERRFGSSLGRIRLIGRRWAYPLEFVHAARYTGTRLALIGDAAHAIHPIAGQGLNLSLRDVAALAEAVVDAARLGLDPGEEGALRRYQSWRRFDSLAVAAVTDGLNRLFSNDLAPLRLARDLGLAAVDRMPVLKRFFMRQAMGMVGELPRLARGEAL